MSQEKELWIDGTEYTFEEAINEFIEGSELYSKFNEILHHYRKGLATNNYLIFSLEAYIRMEVIEILPRELPVTHDLTSDEEGHF